MGLSRPTCITDKSDDVYHDYLISWSATHLMQLKFRRLDSAATFAEYETWESYMVRGFARCHTLDSKFGGHMEFVIAYRRVDTKVASWWCDDRSVNAITSKTSSWEDFKQFLHTRFV
jgi:hypothetical protein